MLPMIDRTMLTYDERAEAVDTVRVIMAARRMQAQVMADLFSRLFRLPAKIVSWYRNQQDQSLTYHELMELDDRQLADIGIERSMIGDVAMTGRHPGWTDWGGNAIPANSDRPSLAA